ncbi:IS1096 element passenger TnpR family protein [Nostoc sp.]
MSSSIGACSPEDCGGIWGYAQLQEVIADPKHQSMRKCWNG